jgi:PTH1 family peptidyl-tRNA hydrolase
MQLLYGIFLFLPEVFQGVVAVQKSISVYNFKMKWIIVGLGNPGSEYATTRHNAGRIALDHIRESKGFSDWKYSKTYDALTSKGEIAGKEVLLLEPETYMNESGKSLMTLIKSDAHAAQLIVVHDDADLHIGSWRFAFARGAGGQKGVASIITCLKTKAFIRVRIGIAPIPQMGEPHKKAGDYVLGKFREGEMKMFEQEVSEIISGVEQLLAEGLELARSKWQKHGPREEQKAP